MAITKIHPIKTTLKKAIYYITNPKKTEDCLYVSSFACAPQTADIEFKFTQTMAKYKSNIVLARHMEQIFKPGEVAPEQAHEIGKQFADEVLEGKYEYVIATHVDKDHIHNHIIFNNVDFIDYKRYDSNKRSYHRLRRISDRLCRENNLSVIKDPVAKNISRKEYEERKKGTSWKAQLQKTIDNAIKRSKTFDDFLSHMKAAGYDIKQGKHIAFRAPGQERYTRSKTIGEAYTEEAIRKKIQDKNIGKKRNTIYRPNVLRVNFFVKIKAHAKANSRGYEHWAKVRNLKEAANTLNFLATQNIENLSSLRERLGEIETSQKQTLEQIKLAEQKIKDMSQVLVELKKYQKLKPVYDTYLKTWNKTKYRSAHESELILFEASQKILQEKNINPDSDIAKLIDEFKDLSKRKDELYSSYHINKNTLNNYKKAYININEILNKPVKKVVQEKER